MKGIETIERLGRTLFLFGLLMMPTAVFGFDTGHHSDLTREALQDAGFGETAIKIVQVQNWLTDYFNSSPTSSIDSDLKKLHFDNLVSRERVRNYWGWLALKTRDAIQKAARDDDALTGLALLAISLHAVQDFYSHSNWVDTHPRNPGSPYRTDTWFNPPQGGAGVALHTGVTSTYPGTPPPGAPTHGGYTGGMNKDSYIRPGWEEAYVFAYSASREWVNAVRTWIEQVRPAFWNQLLAVSLSNWDRARLEYDLEAAYRISEWIALDGNQGHWKGSGSGSNADFVPFWTQWASTPSSPFVRLFTERRVYRLLSDGLSMTGDSPPSSELPAVPKVTLDRRAVVLGTTSIAEDGVGWREWKIDPGGKADFYARITVAGQRFLEAMQLDQFAVSPYWTTMKFVPTTTTGVTVRYELWDEDSGVWVNDDLCDINPAGGKRWLDFGFALDTHLCSGDVTGIHDSTSSAFLARGARPDSDRAQILFSVTARSLQEPGAPSPNPTPVPPVKKLRVRMDPQPARDVPTTVTVYAEDSETHAPVVGKVWINGVSVSPTNQPFTYTFTCLRLGPGPGGGLKCPIVSVTASGYERASVSWSFQ